MKRALLLAALLSASALAQTQPAQTQPPALSLPTPSLPTDADWLVQTVVPSVISVRAPKSGLSFAIDTSNYPPVNFPAQYAANPFPVQVLVNTAGTWNLQITLRDIRNDQGALLIPVNHIQLRVNGGPWTQATGTPQVIWTQRGSTVGWQTVAVDFQLQLDGSEQGGSYQTLATFSALVLP